MLRNGFSAHSLPIGKPTVQFIGNGGHAAVCKEIPYSGYADYFVAVGDNKARMREVEQRQGSFATLIHPSATVSASSVIGSGTVIMAGSVIQARTRIGKHCIVNSQAVVDHDCVIGDFSHIAPGSTLCGGVSVGSGSLIGAGSTVIPSVKIGSNVVVGAGATVVNNIPDGVTVIGTPARTIGV